MDREFRGFNNDECSHMSTIHSTSGKACLASPAECKLLLTKFRAYLISQNSPHKSNLFFWLFYPSRFTWIANSKQICRLWLDPKLNFARRNPISEKA